jgi:hypothetical protein
MEMMNGQMLGIFLGLLQQLLMPVFLDSVGSVTGNINPHLFFMLPTSSSICFISRRWHVVWNDCIVSERCVENDVAVAYFKVLFRHLYRGTEENHEIRQ